MSKGHKSRGKTRERKIERKNAVNQERISSKLGRDPTKGQLAFRTGANLSEKDKLLSRRTKNAKKEMKDQCEQSSKG